ncbi:MAG: CDP-alcohol phosphatidyltransferase family protein [Spirosomaceae bacterium]|nr:CDP-alcohol phosphatidyltransferase family protein [Spirosomataceae bacterium]
MAKLAAKDKFFDLSDYGRAPATLLANSLKNTSFTPVRVTYLFGVCGLVASYCIFKEYYIAAAFFLILKSILDAADGELARVKQTPSYTGRYLDSVFDILLNFIILCTIGYVAQTPAYLIFLAFAAVQLQGTLYNYYYVILRNKSEGGDTTSKVFEYKSPRALPGENQKTVDFLFQAYTFCYGIFDKAIHLMDKTAHKAKVFPSWFMTLVSMYGLGFQLLIIAIMLPLGLISYIIPFFIWYSVLIFVLIGIRRFVL